MTDSLPKLSYVAGSRQSAARKDASTLGNPIELAKCKFQREKIRAGLSDFLTFIFHLPQIRVYPASVFNLHGTFIVSTSTRMFTIRHTSVTVTWSQYCSLLPRFWSSLREKLCKRMQNYCSSLSPPSFCSHPLRAPRSPLGPPLKRGKSS